MSGSRGGQERRAGGGGGVVIKLHGLYCKGRDEGATSMSLRSLGRLQAPPDVGPNASCADAEGHHPTGLKKKWAFGSA